jgi:hypothetical protein
VNGFENGPYVVSLKLAYHIPEYLPIWGKKARVYYHGIPIFCGSCHDIGHSRSECRNRAITWTDYIRSLSSTGIPSELFGSWLSTNLSTTRDTQPIAQPSFVDDDFEFSEDEDGQVDLSKIPPKMLKLIKKLKVSTPKSSAKIEAALKTKSKTHAKRKPLVLSESQIGKGKGRGRGAIAPKKPKGRGRGRAN